MNLHKTLAAISGMTMLSRVTGLLREVLIARTFGASAATDAFNVAFRIPNLLRRLFAEGAFSQAFVPILAEYKTQKGDRATHLMVDHVATVLTWALTLTTLAGIVFAPAVVYFTASGLEGHTFDITVVMTRMMFPYIGFMSLVALAGGILNTWREFKIPAFTPVLLNICSILASLFLVPFMKTPIYAMAIAVFVGGVLQLAIQVPALVRIGMLPHVSWNPRFALTDPGVRRVLRQMVPAIAAVSVAQISLVINTNIASHLQAKSVTWLTYADRLMEFPTAMLGVALGTILLPNLSKASSEGNTEEYSALLDWGLRLSFLLAMPAAVGLATLSVPMTATLFHYGKFDSESVTMTSNAVIAYGVGLIGLIVVKILAPGFYAKQDIRTPVKIALIVLAATQAMNLLFVHLYQHAGLALSIGLGACLNASFLYWGLRRKNIYTPHPGWALFFVRLAGALALMAGTALWLERQFDWVGLRAHIFERMAALGLVLAACAVVYFAALLLTGFRFADFKRVAK
ncbi:MAG TPA: murein biosynthesis integral membrane protein MurJ [Burkholderiaceae bacterium]